MSELIERVTERHVNIKDQDKIVLREDNLRGPECATLIFELFDQWGRSRDGRLFLNGLSLEKLGELQARIGDYLQTQKSRIEQHLEDMAAGPFGSAED